MFYCSLLASAQSETEKEELRRQMKSDPSLRKILGQLENEEPMDVEVKMQPKKEVFFSGRVFFSLRFTQVFSLLPLVS